MNDEIVSHLVGWFGIESYFYVKRISIFFLGMFTMYIIGMFREARRLYIIEKDPVMKGLALLPFKKGKHRRVYVAKPDSVWEAFRTLFYYKLVHYRICKPLPILRDNENVPKLVITWLVILLLVVLIAIYLIVNIVVDLPYIIETQL